MNSKDIEESDELNALQHEIRSNSGEILFPIENTSDIRTKLRINQEKLQSLLNNNPLHVKEILKKISDEVAESSDCDIPVPTGPLRLSVYRQNSPEDQSTTSNYDVTHRYPSLFESFVKRRPLSESFACIRELSDFDLSSSSDEDLSDPVPESPLNLSDTDNSMETPEVTPIATRRRKFFNSASSKDARPKSLYDSAKPRPPSTDRKSSKVGERLSRLKWPWRNSGAKADEISKSSYERSFEPTPDEWSNVVSPTSQRLQPRPPATSPTHPLPSPRKKRHAPKPPTDIQPYLPKDSDVETDQQKTNSVTDPLTSKIAPKTDKEKESPIQGHASMGSPVSETFSVPDSVFDEVTTKTLENTNLETQNSQERAIKNITLPSLPAFECDFDTDSKSDKNAENLVESSNFKPKRSAPMPPPISENALFIDSKTQKKVPVKHDKISPAVTPICPPISESAIVQRSNQDSIHPEHILSESSNEHTLHPSDSSRLLPFDEKEMELHDLNSPLVAVANSSSSENTQCLSEKSDQPILSQKSIKTVHTNELSTPQVALPPENDVTPQGQIVPKHIEPTSALLQVSNKHIVEPIITPITKTLTESDPTQTLTETTPKIPVRKHKHINHKMGVNSERKIPQNVIMPSDDCDITDGVNFDKPHIPPQKELDNLSQKLEFRENMQLQRAKFLEIPASGTGDVKGTIKIVIDHILKSVDEMATAKTDIPINNHINEESPDIAANEIATTKTDILSNHSIPSLQKTSAGDVLLSDVTEADDAMDVFDHVISSTVALRDTPRDQAQRNKTTKHRKSVDNASSGYSSPGSGDEGPTSPRPTPSMTSLPSPTSSYYSTSLSASSSRVSDLSRELTLAKSSIREVNIDEDITNTKTEIEQTQERQLEVDKNNKEVDKINVSQSDNTVFKDSDKDSELEPQNNKIKHTNIEPSSVKIRSVSDREFSYDVLPDKPISLRHKTSTTRIRAKSEYIPYRTDNEEWQKEASRVSICMIEKPTEAANSLSRSQARLFKPSQNRAPSKKKALAAQKSRAFAMRAKPHWRHSYADPSSFILDETDSEPKVPSSNLVSHFVSTQNISTYYDGTEQKTVTPQEILTSKREEFFNAFKATNISKNSEKFGGSVRQLPVSSKEFGFANDIIHEVSEVDSPSKSEIQENKENLIQRQHSGTSSTGSSNHCSSQSSSIYAGSTWSLSADMATQARHRKPSLRRRLKGAFSFQNIRKAISMEKLDSDEKRRSMSHNYLGENGVQESSKRQRSATIDVKSPTNNNNVPVDQTNLRKAPSISSIFSSVAMRKRKSRTRADNTNRYTIADPENFAKNAEINSESKRSTLRPLSMILSNTNKRKLEDVGSPAFFRPIGRVLQMNPAEGTLLVEMVKPSSGPFGFYIARKKEAGDSGSVFISRLSDSYPDKMFAGLMRTGDEITEVNGKNVSKLSLDEVYDLILDSDKTLLKLKPAQVHVV